jgi:AraC-like DNA-binding protein
MIGGYATTVSCAIVRRARRHALPMHSLTFSSLVHSAGFALGVLLAVLLLTNKRGNRAANRWLAAYISCLALLWFEDVVEETRVILVYPSIAHLTDWMLFLVGPCLWMYVRRLTKNEKPTFLWWLPHTWLAVLCFLFLATNFYFEPRAQKIATIRADYALLERSINEGVLIAALHVMCYWIASLFVLRRFNKSLRERYSSLGERSFGWLRTMLSITLVMWIIWFVSLLQVAPGSNVLASVAVVPGVYLLAFFGLRQPQVFLDEEEEGEPAAPVAPTTTNAGRYARSGMDRERVPEFLARLDDVMRSEKPWLESDLTLADLAARAELSPHNLSQLLNEEIGKSFFDYINSQRVDEVKRCLADPAYDSQTILEIALGAGFSSKTAFNAAFRQHASTTPSEFRRRARTQAGMQSA